MTRPSMLDRTLGYCSEPNRLRTRFERVNVYIHFISPVVHRFLIVNFFPQAVDESTGRPDLASLLLFGKHGIENGHEPVLEFAIVVVGDDEVPDAVHATAAEVSTVHIEVGEVSLAKALDEILFDTASSGNQSGDVLVFGKVEDEFAQTGGNEI